MAFSNWLHFIVCCFVVAALVCRVACDGEASFEMVPSFRDKKVVGDVVMTYTDVSVTKCAVHCASSSSCWRFTYSAQERRCTFCVVCGDFSLVDAIGHRLYVLTAIGQNQAKAGVCPSQVVIPQKCWKQLSGSFSHVSVGLAGTWGINARDEVFFMRGTYQNPFNAWAKWNQMYGELTQIDVSRATVWGVNSINVIYYRENVTLSTPVGTDWVSRDANTRLKWISASPGGSLWGRNTADQLVHYQNSAWQEMDMYIQKVDAGLAGVWVLDITGHLFHRLGTYGDSGSAGIGWRGVEGTYRSVASGKDLVVAVDMGGQVWLRFGLGPDTPTGLAWVRYPGSMKQVDVCYQADMGTVFWGVDSAGHTCRSVIKD